MSPSEPDVPVERIDDVQASARHIPVGPVAIVMGLVAFAVALSKVAGELADILGLLLFASALAWLLTPMKAAIARRIGTGGSIVVIVLGVLIVGLGIGGLLVADLSSGADALSDRVRASLAPGGDRSWFSRLQGSLQLDRGVADWLTSLPSRMVFGANGTPALGQRVVDMLVVVVLAAFLLASGGSVIAALVAAWPRDEREKVWRLLGDVDARAGAFLRHSVMVALVCGGGLGVVGAVVGVPVPVALGIWAGFWLAVPTLGWLVAVLPMIVTAASVDRVPVMVLIASTLVCAFLVRRRRDSSGRAPFRLGVGVVIPCLAIGVAISGSGVALLLLVVGTIGYAVITSEHRHLAMPLAHLDDEHVYRVGPIEWPTGFRGVVSAALVVSVGVLMWTLVIRSTGAIVWITVAAFLAIACDRPVDFLGRKLRVGRRAALVLTLSVLAVAVGSLTLTIVNQGPKSTERALQELPKVVEDMQDAPLIGGWLTDQDAATKVRDELERLPSRISESRGALAWFPSIGSQVADVVWVILLTIAFVLDGGRLMAALTREVPVRHRRQFTRLVGVSHQALAGYAAGAVLVSAMNGVVVLILAIVLHIGLAAVLALWAFLWDFIPQVGGIIGGVPLMLFALIRGPGPFMIATIVYLVYQLIESNVIFPAIIGDSVDIPPWATMVAALVGAAAGGVLGAIVLTPLVGVVRSAMVEYRRDDFPGRTTA